MFFWNIVPLAEFHEEENNGAMNFDRSSSTIHIYLGWSDYFEAFPFLYLLNSITVASYESCFFIFHADAQRNQIQILIIILYIIISNQYIIISRC